MPIIRFITSKGGKIHDLYLNNLTMAITFDWKKKNPLVVEQGGTVILSGLVFKGEPLKEL